MKKSILVSVGALDYYLTSTYYLEIIEEGFDKDEPVSDEDFTELKYIYGITRAEVEKYLEDSRDPWDDTYISFYEVACTLADKDIKKMEKENGN